MSEANGRVESTASGQKRDNKLLDEDEEEEEVVGVVPPDGGWGWMVVLSSFLIHIIADGIVYSFGIFFVEFVDYFNSTHGETAWIASILVGLTLGSGPIASVVTNRFGCRPCTMAGGVVASLGLILGVFSPSIQVLYLTFGLIAGFGFGLIYLPAIVSVGFYFEKKRAIATGLAVCGSGVGTFIFAPLCNVLVEEYTWKGATLILAGLVLNGLVCGALFRPLPVERKSKKKQKLEAKNDAEKDRLLSNGGQSEAIPSTEMSTDPVISQYQKNIASAPITPLEETPSTKLTRRLASADYVPTHKSSEPQVMYYELHDDPKDQERLQDERRKEESVRITSTNLKPSDAVSHPMDRKDVFYSGSLNNIPMYRSNPDLYHKSMTSIHKLGLDGTPLPSKQSSPVSPDVSKPGCCNTSNVQTCKKMIDLTLLKDPVFLLFAVSNFLTSIGFNAPFIYIPDRAEKELGLTRTQGAMLLSVVGVSNTVGRVLFGFTSDHPIVRRRRLFVYNGALTVCGVATMLSVYATTYYTMIAYAATFGITIGAYVTLTSVLLVDLLGLEKLTNSFGILLLFQGVATLGGPPLAGSLYDMTKSYTIPFLVVGACLGISGLMLFPIPNIQRYIARRKGVEEVDVQMGMKVDTDCKLVVSNTETVL